MIGLDPLLESAATSDLARLRWRALRDLYLFAKGIVGYKDMTSRVHRGLCNFMQDENERFLLALMPRGHFKTSINLANCLRKLAVDPERRILLVNESAENAESMLGEIKGHLLSNQRLQMLFPELVPDSLRQTTWSSNAILLPRQGSYREASIEAAGVMTKLVSRHYTDISGDDLISVDAMQSPTVMDKAKKFVNRLDSLLVNPSKDYVTILGTRWAFDDVYSHIIEKHPYFKLFIRKAIVQGPTSPEPFFPERWTMEQFQAKIENDPHEWATQFANDPLDSGVADFRREWLQYFEVTPERRVRYVDVEGVTHLIDLEALNFYIHVDPSVGDSITADETGIVVVGIGPLGEAFVLDAWKNRIDPVAQVNKILELNEAYRPLKVTIESNAYQKALAYFLEEEARKRGDYVPVETFTASSRRSKQARIRAALQPQFSTGNVWVRRGLVDFIDEYFRFGKTESDHLLDAFAQGPMFWRKPYDKVAVERHARFQEAALRPRGLTGYGI